MYTESYACYIKEIKLPSFVMKEVLLYKLSVFQIDTERNKCYNFCGENSVEADENMNFDINNFTVKIICEGESTDTVISTESKDREFDLFITATADKPKFVELYWEADTNEDLLILGDAWERSYGNLQFLSVSENDRWMPWYFIATDKKKCFCFGVKTGCNSFVSFRYDKKGITALVDVRNSGSGVQLGGRKLMLATFIFCKYESGEFAENIETTEIGLFSRMNCLKILPLKNVQWNRF